MTNVPGATNTYMLLDISGVLSANDIIDNELMSRTNVLQTKRCNTIKSLTWTQKLSVISLI